MAELEGTEEDDPLIGSLIDGRYRVIRRIGEGGMGAVYEVEHVRIARRLALKTLHAQLALNEDLVARFYREAMAAGAIGHEHIVQVNDMGHLDSGEPFLVMELLEGHDVATEIGQRGPLPVARAVRIALQACEALAAAHEKGIVHRDLKPENIFLLRHRKQQDFVKLLDFGISKFKEGSIALGGSMTRTGAALGTPYYMTPEQVEGVREIDGRTDLYALACVLFELLAGRVPFDAPTFPALVVKITNDPPPPLTELRGDVPPELDAVIRRGLAKAREERFEDMESFARALAPFAQEDPGPFAATEAAAPAAVLPAGAKSTVPAAALPSGASAAQSPGPASNQTPNRTSRGTSTPKSWETQASGEALPRSRARLLLVAGAVLAVAGGSAMGLTLWPSDGVQPGGADEARSAAAMGGDGGGGIVPSDGPADAEQRTRSSDDDLPVATAAGTPDAGAQMTADASAADVPREARAGAGSSTQPQADRPQRAARRERSGRMQPKRRTASRRAVLVRNTRRASVTVELDCSGRGAKVDVAAGAQQRVRAWRGSCRVRCTGVGRPSCPLTLHAGQSSIVVR